MTTFDDVEIPGIGPSRRGRLLSAGVRDVEALAALDPKTANVPGIPPAILHAAIAAARTALAKPTAAEAKKPVEATKPTAAEAKKPVEATKPAEAPKAVEATKPAEAPKAVEAATPAEATKPAEAPKAVEATTPAEATKPVEPPPGLPPVSDWLGRLAALAKDARRHARDARANGPRARARKQLARLRDALAEAQTRVQSGPMPAAWGTVLHSAEGALTRFLQDKPRKRAVEEVAEAAKGARKELA